MTNLQAISYQPSAISNQQSAASNRPRIG